MDIDEIQEEVEVKPERPKRVAVKRPFSRSGRRPSVDKKN